MNQVLIIIEQQLAYRLGIFEIVLPYETITFALFALTRLKAVL